MRLEDSGKKKTEQYRRHYGCSGKHVRRESGNKRKKSWNAWIFPLRFGGSKQIGVTGSIVKVDKWRKIRFDDVGLGTFNFTLQYENTNVIFADTIHRVS